MSMKQSHNRRLLDLETFIVVFMFVLAGCFLISALSEILNVKLLIWIGQALFVVSLIIGLIYINTRNRFK